MHDGAWLRRKPSPCFSWVFYEDKQYSGNLYVLSEGDYPNLTSMGCPPGFTVRSIKVVPMVRKHSHIKVSAVILSSVYPLNLHLSLSRHSRFPPSLCLASSVWRAERSPQRQRSSAWLKRASTTTFCLSESTAAGECLSPCVCDCLQRVFGHVQFVCLHSRMFVCIGSHHEVALCFSRLIFSWQ